MMATPERRRAGLLASSQNSTEELHRKSWESPGHLKTPEKNVIVTPSGKLTLSPMSSLVSNSEFSPGEYSVSTTTSTIYEKEAFTASSMGSMSIHTSHDAELDSRKDSESSEGEDPAIKARKQSELERARVSSARMTVRNEKRQYKKLLQAYKQVREEVESLRRNGRGSTESEEMESLRMQLTKKEDDLMRLTSAQKEEEEKLQCKISELEEKNARLAAEVEEVQSKSRESEVVGDSLAQKDSELAALTKRLEEQTLSLEDKGKQLEKVQGELTKAREKLAQNEEQSKESNDITQVEQQLRQKENELSELRKKLEMYEKRISKLVSENDSRQRKALNGSSLRNDYPQKKALKDWSSFLMYLICLCCLLGVQFEMVQPEPLVIPT